MRAVFEALKPLFPGPVVTRYAPSPTGFLHYGHVVNALWVWEAAEVLEAEVIVRLEDHDRSRCRPEYDAAILDDLGWLGFLRNEVIVRQSQRQHLYQQALDHLRTRAHVYACDCSRKFLEEKLGTASDDERCYPGYCRDKNLPLSGPYRIRVELPRAEIAFTDALLGPQFQIPSEQCGDLLLRDNLGNWTYQFCVVVDDFLQNVNLIIRGADILSSTGRQIQLAQLLGRETMMPVFLHHPLLVDAQGRKLSKRDFAADIHALHLQGVPAAEVLAEARRLGS